MQDMSQCTEGKSPQPPPRYVCERQREMGKQAQSQWGGDWTGVPEARIHVTNHTSQMNTRGVYREEQTLTQVATLTVVPLHMQGMG